MPNVHAVVQLNGTHIPMNQACIVWGQFPRPKDVKPHSLQLRPRVD